MLTNRVELSVAERFPFAEGQEFGAIGAYERLVGRARFAVDPGAPAQQGITDIEKAPTDADGLVRFAGDFSLLKPVDPVSGPVRVEYIADRSGITTFPLSGHASTRSHPTVSLDPREASLTRRRYPDDERLAVPPESWHFARIEGGVGLDNQGTEQALIPSDTHIHIPGGFEPGWIYELVYTGRDPLVLGLGHAAVRDFVSFLRYAADNGAGLGTIEKAYAWGRSQTGRCIRDFVYRGFNADAAGCKVFDGILPHVAGAGRKWLNHRFANAVVSGGQQYEDHFCELRSTRRGIG